MRKTLVLLHGWGFDASVWCSFIPYLESNFDVLALDLLGFGRNQTTQKSLSLQSLAEDVLLRSPQSSVFLGWSLGGLVAIYIAIHYPRRVTHLIGMATTPRFVVDADWPGLRLSVLKQFSDALKSNYQRTLDEFLLLQFQGEALKRRAFDFLRTMRISSVQPSNERLDQGLAILKETDLRASFASILCPQLYLFGRCDRLVLPQLAEKLPLLNANIKTRVLEKLSHAPFLSRPQCCADHIQKFLLC